MGARMGLRLTPGSKTRLLAQLDILTQLVKTDADKDLITFRATELAHHATGLCTYEETPIPKKRVPHRCDGIIDTGPGFKRTR